MVERLRDLPEESVHCVVTSPPYWGLRDYSVPGQFAGSGTTLVTARRLGRHAVGIELNPEYAQLAEKRCAHWWKTPARPRGDGDPDQPTLFPEAV